MLNVALTDRLAQKESSKAMLPLASIEEEERMVEADLSIDNDMKKAISPNMSRSAALWIVRTGGNPPWVEHVMNGVLATLERDTNSYIKQESNPKMLELARFSKQHIPAKLVDKEAIEDERIWRVAKMGLTVNPSKIDGDNMREQIMRYNFY